MGLDAIAAGDEAVEPSYRVLYRPSALFKVLFIFPSQYLFAIGFP